MRLLLMAVLAITGAHEVVADLVVTNKADTGPGTLRQAILDANSLGGGTITFASVSGTIMMESGLPILAADTTIVGPGTNQLTLKAPNSVFTNATANTAYISGLSLEEAGGGAIIQNYGSLTLNECIVQNAHGASAPPYAPPRGIANSGTLTLNGCSISGNHTQSGNPGVGIYNTGSMNLNNCAVTGNAGGLGTEGAGIYTSGSAILNNCDVSANDLPDNLSGAGIYNSGTLCLTNCTLRHNESRSSSGGSGVGGGIYNVGKLTLASCTIAGNSGGGISSHAGTVLLLNCSVTNNYKGGGYSANGGGIYNEGQLDVIGCTISGNNTDARYDFDSFSHGGGLYNGGTANLINTTISGNQVTGEGGGICNGGNYYITNAATLRLLNCTIVSNFVSDLDEPQGGGGIWNAGTLDSQNSIIAGNKARHSPDFQGPLIADGPNLIQDTNGLALTSLSTGLIRGLNPPLGPLQDNGGPTWTHALLAGSPAIDAGSSLGAPATDQRGVARPQGFGVDLGAFEYQQSVAGFVGLARQYSTNLWLRAWGLPGVLYGLDTSTNLVDWVRVGSLAADPSGLCEYVDQDMRSHPQRFYRIK